MQRTEQKILNNLLRLYVVHSDTFKAVEAAVLNALTPPLWNATCIIDLKLKSKLSSTSELAHAHVHDRRGLLVHLIDTRKLTT